MNGRVLTCLATAGAAAVVACGGLLTAAFTGLGGSSACLPGAAEPSATASGARGPALAEPPGGWGRVGPWDSRQVANAAIIIRVGAQRGVPSRGWLIAVATAMQESSLRNLAGGDRDSIGLFQQRPSQGWGTPRQLRDSNYAARRFYRTLLKVPGWQSMTVADAAQAVQKSAYPNAYAKHERPARKLIAQLTGASGRALAGCSAKVGPDGWVAPVDAPVVSGFGDRGGGFHAGADLGARRGTPVRAAAAGSVTAVLCNAYAPDGSVHSCAVDGSPQIAGCGWYVDIQHPNGVLTRYCHMLRRPRVKVGQPVAAGQVIGVVGSSGNSSGPHLHYEIRRHDRPVDPVPWHRARHASLGAAGR